MDNSLMHTIGELAGFVAGAIGVAFAVPQIVRIRKLGHAEGVALSMWLILCITYSAWGTYGIQIGSPAIFISNIFTYTLGALVIVGIRGNRFSSYAIMAGISVVTILFMLLAPSFAIQGLLILLTFSRLPQLAKSWQNRGLSQATAVSMRSLVIGLTSAVFWMTYSIMTERSLLVLTTALALSMTLATFVIEYRIAVRAKLVQAINQ